MKNTSTSLLLFLWISIAILGCKTSHLESNSYCAKNKICGLWVGHYIVKGFEHVNIADGTKFYLSFSIYPDGTLSYKSKGRENEYNLSYITFADGIWTLEGEHFTFNATSINLPTNGDSQHSSYGTAFYNSKEKSLKGTITDPKISTFSFELWKVE